MKKLMVLGSCLMVFTLPLFAQQETLTITTYYPAPFGVYQRLVTNSLGVGDTNASGGIDAGDAPDPTANPGDAWIAGNVGIGSTTPQNRLDVAGGVVIGSAFAGVQNVNGNNLAVQSRLGIGVIPTRHLHVRRNQPQVHIEDETTGKALNTRINAIGTGATRRLEFKFPDNTKYMQVTEGQRVEMLERFRLPVRTSAPSSPVTGELWIANY